MAISNALAQALMGLLGKEGGPLGGKGGLSQALTGRSDPRPVTTPQTGNLALSATPTQPGINEQQLPFLAQRAQRALEEAALTPTGDRADIDFRFTGSGQVPTVPGGFGGPGLFDVPPQKEDVDTIDEDVLRDRGVLAQEGGGGGGDPQRWKDQWQQDQFGKWDFLEREMQRRYAFRQSPADFWNNQLIGGYVNAAPNLVNTVNSAMSEQWGRNQQVMMAKYRAWAENERYRLDLQKSREEWEMKRRILEMIVGSGMFGSGGGQTA